MKLTYASPAVRQRLTEFLGGDCLEHATAAYLTRSDSCQFSQRELAPPSEIRSFLEQDLDIARSLADAESFLLHLDIEYVNFDSPAEALTDPWRAFELQEPVVRVIESLLLQWGIRPLHIITDQGHHFVWRVRRTSLVARRILSLAPAPELVDACMERVPPLLVGRIDEESQRAFSATALIVEFVANCIKQHLAREMDIVIQKLSGHLKLVHINDNRGDWDAHLAPGEGTIDWPWVVNELRRNDYHGPLVLELHGGNEAVKAVLARAVRAREFLAKVCLEHPC